jgi:hypothetical protein
VQADPVTLPGKADTAGWDERGEDRIEKIDQADQVFRARSARPSAHQLSLPPVRPIPRSE